MTNIHRPLKVFLCHAHADRDAVRALYNRLVKDGVDVWLDKKKLLPGQDWGLEIRKARTGFTPIKSRHYEKTENKFAN